MKSSASRATEKPRPTGQLIANRSQHGFSPGRILFGVGEALSVRGQPEGSRQSIAGCGGYCRDCERVHRLPEANARRHARDLMGEFEKIRRLDYRVSSRQADPRLSFDRLFPRERGHMFGVLECRNQAGETVVLRAFSSLHDGIREIDGWVPPLLSAESFYGVVLPEQEIILRLSAEMRELSPGSRAFAERLSERKRISQNLLSVMQGLYRFHNFRGESRSLRDAFSNRGGIPGGVGECCAPKLLNHAVKHSLEPIGIAEFYWGGSSRSGSRRSGEFYPACASRCQAVLGFMLCGLPHAT